MSELLKDGEPCGHPGCLSHISHPCEKCGRIAGKRIEFLPLGTRALLDEAEKIILAQQDLLICYRIGKRPAEKTLNTLTKSNPRDWLEKKRKAGEG